MHQRADIESTPAEDAGERGQGMAEYALIISLVAVVAIVTLIFVGTSISSTLSTIGHTL